MVDLRAHYRIYPDDLLDVEIVQEDGARVLVSGRIDAVPETTTGHRALSIRLTVTSIKPLCPPPTAPLPSLRLVASD